MPGGLLDSQASFELAAFVATGIAIVLLILVVGNLHARLRRLEQSGNLEQAGNHAPATTAAADAPYGHLLGKDLHDLTGAPRHTHVLLVLSTHCGSCRRVLEDVASPSWTASTALLWTDSQQAGVAPDGVTVLENGPRISSELGIRVTPFALVADKAGRVVTAAPVRRLRSLARLNLPPTAEHERAHHYQTEG